MVISPLSHLSVASWDRRTFAGLLGGLVVIGLALQAFVLVRLSPAGELARILLVPIVVGTLVYVRYRPTAGPWEIGAVAVWGVFAQRIGGFIWLVIAIGYGGAGISISSALLSGGAQFRLMVLLRFLGTTAVFAGFYATAASRRDRPVVSAITLFAVLVAIVVIHMVI